MSRNILVIPDAFIGTQSGALAAQELARILVKIGYQVGIFSPDLRHCEAESGYRFYPRQLFSYLANYGVGKHENDINRVIDDFRPEIVFSIGGIINRPVSYIDIIHRRRIFHCHLIFCQDYYCARIHAALEDGPCYRCLLGTNMNAFRYHCGEKTERNAWLFLLNGLITRQRISRRINKVDVVLGSSREQLELFKKFNVDPQRIAQLHLFFPNSRLDNVNVETGNYFIIAGQNRLEKGIHLLKHVLERTKGDVKVKIAFSGSTESQKAIQSNGLGPYVDQGLLIPLDNVTWEDGLKELYAHARGVLITSIWPTTTEYAFLEALGLGKPVIAFDVGIHREVLKSRKNGLLVPLNEYSTFASLMSELNCNDALCKQLGREARMTYEILTNEEAFINGLKHILPS